MAHDAGRGDVEVAARTQWADFGVAATGGRAPAMGTVDRRTAGTLAQILARATTTPGEATFAFWVGYAGLAGVEAPVVTLAPDREMLLVEGAV